MDPRGDLGSSWAAVAVALVNTAPTGGHGDLLVRPDQLRDLLAEHGIDAAELGDTLDLPAARRARSGLARIFAAADTGAVSAQLNAMLARTVRPRTVVDDDRIALTWGGLAGSCALALAVIVAEHGADVLDHCAAPDCAHVLARTGAGSPRRFCQDTCASRTRVAAHRARRRAAGPA